MNKKEFEKTINEEKVKTLADITAHKDSALQKLDSLLLTYINNDTTLSKADKLSYWIEDFCNLLKAETTFNPQYMKSYSRGDVIQVNLGYNIGNEEGGLHYCVVIDKHNSKKSGIVTVIPLTSNKGQPLDFSEVYLGDEVYASFTSKYESLMFELVQKLNSFNNNFSREELQLALEKLRFLEKMDSKMQKMKKGSIALVSQITTVSKQKIYDPQKTKDLLSGVRISDTSLDLINEKMKTLFIKK